MSDILTVIGHTYSKPYTVYALRYIVMRYIISSRP